MSPQTIVLMYHHAGAPPPAARKKHLYVSAELLRAHVTLLRKRGYRFSTVSQALASPDSLHACITFDDGYLDVIEIALPELLSLGVPATLYAVTGDVGQGGLRWPEEHDTLPADLADWDALRRLEAAGWEIGSHAHRHLRLARCDEDEQARSIRASFETLTRELGHPPASFAYPYGSYDERTVRLVRAAGFSSAVTTRRGLVQQGDDPFLLRRVNMHGHRAVDAWQTFKLWLSHRRLYPLRKPPLLPAPSTPRT